MIPTPSTRAIVRPEAVRRYSWGVEQAVLPPFVSPRMVAGGLAVGPVRAARRPRRFLDDAHPRLCIGDRHCGAVTRPRPSLRWPGPRGVRPCGRAPAPAQRPDAAGRGRGRGRTGTPATRLHAARYRRPGGRPKRVRPSRGRRAPLSVRRRWRLRPGKRRWRSPGASTAPTSSWAPGARSRCCRSSVGGGRSSRWMRRPPRDR